MPLYEIVRQRYRLVAPRSSLLSGTITLSSLRVRFRFRVRVHAKRLIGVILERRKRHADQ
jgi:hypothetical protein